MLRLWFIYLFIVCSFTKGPPKDDMRITAEPSTGDVEIGLHAVSEGEQMIPGSNASTMSSIMSSCTEHGSNDSSEIGVEEHSKEYELVRGVLYATRDNVNIVHEVFRQVGAVIMIMMIIIIIIIIIIMLFCCTKVSFRLQSDGLDL